MTDTTNTEASQEQTENPQAITIQDLNLLANIVDLASKRGAFQAAELSQIGAVYDKLNAFLSFVEAQQQAQAEAQAEADAQSEENTETQE